MKYRLIYSEYDAVDGVSIAVVKTKYGTFTGVARLHPDDAEYESQFEGCKYAEYRAMIKAGKEELKELRQRLKGLEILQRDLQDGKEYNSMSFEARRLRKRIYEYKSEIQTMEHTIKNSEKLISNSWDSRKKMLDKIRSEKGKN